MSKSLHAGKWRACVSHARPTSRRFATSAVRPADTARIIEVGPRDGLQNEKSTIPLHTKLDLIKRLAGTGVRTIEAGSFVPAKWVPQVSRPARMILLTVNRHTFDT